MFYLDTNTNKRYTIGRPFEYNGVSYTRAGASHATFMSLGFTQVLPQQRPDGAYYVVSGPDNTGAYTSTPRDLAQLKSNFILQTKRHAHDTLRNSDWYVIRLLELGATNPTVAAVPASVSSYRAAIRAASDARCTQISSMGSVEQLESLMKAPSQIYDVENEVYIDNPAPHLYEWPERLDPTVYIA